MKKLFSGVMLVMLLLGLPFMAVAGPSVYLEGNKVNFPDLEPFVEDGVTQVPLRSVAEMLGAEVVWNGEERSALINLNGRSIKLTIGCDKALVNGSEQSLLAGPRIYEERTVVPLRVVSETLGLQVGWNGEQQRIDLTADASGLSVYFLDVGQAESVYISYKDFDVLIDGGNNDDEGMLVDFLESMAVDDIEYVIATHSHEDHIGGLDAVINAFDVENIIISPDPAESVTYEDFMAAVNGSGANVINDITATYSYDSSLYFRTFECGDDYTDHNNQSVIAKLFFRGKTFMFTGDAEKEVEEYLTENFSSELDADVFLAGHHGSDTSNTAAFLDLVSPDLVVISAGEDNKYGHPIPEIVDRFHQYTDEVYCTKDVGTVILTTDGNGMELSFGGAAGSVTVDVQDSPVVTPVPQTDNMEACSALSIISVDKNKEEVCIKNVSAENVEMQGCTLVSVDGNQTYVFPHYVLSSGETLTVYSGRGAGDLKWTGSYIWDNEEPDEARIYDVDGSLLDSFL